MKRRLRDSLQERRALNIEGQVALPHILLFILSSFEIDALVYR